MSKGKKALSSIVFITILFLLKYWLGFEVMIMIVICAWFTTMLEEKNKS